VQHVCPKFSAVSVVCRQSHDLNGPTHRPAIFESPIVVQYVRYGRIGHRLIVLRHVMRHRGFCRPVVDNAGHDAITGTRRWRVRSDARRFCGVPPER
jgi:hypothetical protein